MDDNRRASRAIVVGVCAVLAAVWVIPGVALNENRVLREFPDLSRAGVASAADFRAVDGALLDRLSAKGTVVSVLGASLVGAGFSTTTGVFRGPSGEPFLGQDFVNPCVSKAQIEAVDTMSRDLQTYLADYGIDVLWAIAPDKSSIEREALGPAGDRIMECADAARDTLQAFADAPDSPLLVAWDELSAEPERVYLYGDSHWNPLGGARFAELIIDRLGEEGIATPGLFDRNDLVEGETVEPPGDLFFIMGVDRPQPTTPLATIREGAVVDVELDVHDGVVSGRWLSTGADVVPGRTLLLHDSYFFYNQDVLAPYFADLTSLPLSALGTPGALASLYGYDHVIIQQVQRSVPSYIPDIPAAAWITTGHTAGTGLPVP